MRILKPTKYKKFNKKIFGFDIETYGNKNKFYMGSIWNENPKFINFFYDKTEFINYFKRKIFKNSIISASNLSFDFLGLFLDSDEIFNFNMLWRGSNLLYAKTYLRNKAFNKNYKMTKSHKLLFLDTLNYAGLSVENLGKLINIPKLEKPKFLGKKPKNEEEEEILRNYNLTDSKISALSLKYLYDAFNFFGANAKDTIAQVSMSLYRNKYLKDYYIGHNVDDLDNHFEGYYGGNCQAYARGYIEDYNLYDINSLYPSVMINEYPNPNKQRITHKNTNFYIENYKGLSLIKINIPENTTYPILPFRFDKKLLFPTGIIKGWYSHEEINKAVELGYTILKVYKTYYYIDNCEPYKDFVNDLYALRLKYRKEKNKSMAYIVKIILNSLYGKFGQKFRDRDNWIPLPDSLEELNELNFFERKGNFIRIKKAFSKPSNFCFPIWALYTTSYARLKLFDYIFRCNPLYVDTDSLITKKEFLDSDKLGKLKLEMIIKKGIIVKPKMYSLQGIEKNKFVDRVKIKGLGKKLSFYEFNKLMLNPKISYTKFVKFKESLRRNLVVNEIIEVFKNFSLEDNKRIWESKFNQNELQYSKPIIFEENKKIKRKIILQI